MTKPMQKSMQFMVRVSPQEGQYLRDIAGKIDVPYSQLVRYAIKKHVFETKKKLTKGMVTIDDVDQNGPRSSSLVVRVNDHDYEILQAVCEGLSTTRSYVVRYALKRYFEELKSA